MVAATAAILALGLVLAPADPAAAACQGGSFEELLPLATAVFVGRVTEVDQGGSWATFDVHEAWRGLSEDEIADGVQVRGGPERPEGMEAFVVAGETRHYEPGTRYLVAASRGGLWGGRDRAQLVDSTCSATTEWDEALARHRPADATFRTLGEDALAPEAATADGDGWDDWRWLRGIGLVPVTALLLLAAVRVARGSGSARRGRSWRGGGGA